MARQLELQKQIRQEGREVRDGHALDCDWLKAHKADGQAGQAETAESEEGESSPAAEISLHSKCLYVDRLPPDYRDMGEFRRLFSAVVSPPYCQVRTETIGMMEVFWQVW